MPTIYAGISVTVGNKIRMVGHGRNNLQLVPSGQFYAAIANIRVGHCNAK
jgi:hypothetical protein